MSCLCVLPILFNLFHFIYIVHFARLTYLVGIADSRILTAGRNGRTRRSSSSIVR
jgi:hypothetical protein